jgi:hypothetical protein
VVTVRIMSKCIKHSETNSFCMASSRLISEVAEELRSLSASSSFSKFDRILAPVDSIVSFETSR